MKKTLQEIMDTQTVICQQIGYIRKEIKELKEILDGEKEQAARRENRRQMQLDAGDYP